MQYFDREANAAKASAHIKAMDHKYREKIAASIGMTNIYGEKYEKNDFSGPTTDIDIVDMDTVTAITKYICGKTAVLNFASYKNPGGQFLRGSMAQEEAICHESFLYNVLNQMRERYYAWNIDNKNKALYKNRALYTPDVFFERDDRVYICDVITCASPNKSAALRYRMATDDENLKALDSRIKFILDIAEDNNVDTLILGAFGCGVFGQDPREVSMIFKKYLQTHKFSKVIFAIPGGNNLEVFREVFSNK